MNIVLVNGPARLEVTDVQNCETIADIMAFYKESLNISENATAILNGRSADLDTPISDGDEVAFNKPTGSKG